MNHCKTCAHWRPLFTGEAWGVRSFMDAPAKEQAAVMAKITAIAPDGYPEGTDAIMDIPGWSISSGDQDGDVPGGADWPEWGECALTEFGEENSKKSLARAIDRSRYHAVLRCHGNFGCVQWEDFKCLPVAIF